MFQVNHYERISVVWWLANQSSNPVVQDRFLGEKNMNLLFNFNTVNLLLKANVGRERTNVFILECLGGTVVKLWRQESWEGGEVGKVRKVGGWWSWKGGKGDREWGGKVRGFWFYSKAGDAERVQDFIFLFLLLIKVTKRQDGFTNFCIALGMERLSLHLPQAVRNIVCTSEVECGGV